MSRQNNYNAGRRDARAAIFHYRLFRELKEFTPLPEAICMIINDFLRIEDSTPPAEPDILIRMDHTVYLRGYAEVMLKVRSTNEESGVIIRLLNDFLGEDTREWYKTHLG